MARGTRGLSLGAQWQGKHTGQRRARPALSRLLTLCSGVGWWTGQVPVWCQVQLQAPRGCGRGTGGGQRSVCRAMAEGEEAEGCGRREGKGGEDRKDAWGRGCQETAPGARCTSQDLERCQTEPRGREGWEEGKSAVKHREAREKSSGACPASKSIIIAGAVKATEASNAGKITHLIPGRQAEFTLLAYCSSSSLSIDLRLMSHLAGEGTRVDAAANA